MIFNKDCDIRPVAEVDGFGVNKQARGESEF